MGVSQWPSVALKGSSQVIPQVCPNCLQKAEVDLRYCYIRPWDVLRPTRFFQTFRYCAGCALAAEADRKHKARTGWLLRAPGLLVLLLGAGMSMALLDGGVLPAAQDPAQHKQWAGIAMAVGAAAAALLAWLCARWSRNSAVGRCPSRAGQAVWGLAAYYTGSPLFDILGNSKTYRAARPEWLAALVRANRNQVDDATYHRIVGDEKPSTETKRPFAA